MSYLKLILTTVSILLLIGFYSCNNDSKNKYSKIVNKGIVIVRAESKFKLGLIKVIVFDQKNPQYEGSSRGILYRYNDNMPFNLNDTVVFCLKEEKEFQLAVDVKKIDKMNKPGSLEDRYLVANLLQLNLHLADNSHREGPFHRYGHMTGGGGGGVVKINGSDYKLTKVNLTADNSNSASTELYFIKTNSIDTILPLKGYFFGVVDTFQNNRVVEVSSTHTHTFGSHEH